MGFLEQDELTKNATFQIKVRQAMVKSALAVVGETPDANAAIAAKRHTLGVGILNDVASYELRFRYAVAANPALDSSSSDGDIEFTVNSVWSDLAGVTGTELAA